jgi:excisionase family DNA binding protein
MAKRKPTKHADPVSLFEAKTSEVSTDLREYVTARQAARLLGVVTDHVYRLIDGGRIIGIRLGHEWLIYVPSVHQYLKTKSARGRPPSGR